MSYQLTIKLVGSVAVLVKFLTQKILPKVLAKLFVFFLNYFPASPQQIS